LVISAFVSASPLFGIVVLIDITVGLSWLMKFQAHREVAGIEARRRARLALVGSIPAAHEPAEMVSTSPAVSYARILAVLASILFISVPRGWGRGFLARLQRSIPIAVTSFTEDIQLRDATIIEDVSLMLRVKFTEDSKPFGGEEVHPYLRGAT